MTYKELLEQLRELTPVQLEQNVSVHLLEIDEYIPVWAVGVAVEVQSVLDEDHIVLTA
jgi:hypothetical protein